MTHNNFELSYISVSLAIFAVIWFNLFAYQRRDDFRSKIRDLRDGLFDFMLENGFSFETPAYRETRQMLNGMIRASNKIGPIMFFLFLWLCFDAEDAKAPDSLDKLEFGPLKKRLLAVRHQAVGELVTFVYLQGIFGIFVRVLYFFLKAVNLAYRANCLARSAANQFVNTVAFSLGRQDATASGQFRYLTGSK